MLFNIDEKFIETTKHCAGLEDGVLVHCQQCIDLKDFYFSRRYASDNYEFLAKDEYSQYLNKFYDLLKELKTIKENL